MRKRIDRQYASGLEFVFHPQVAAIFDHFCDLLGLRITFYSASGVGGCDSLVNCPRTKPFQWAAVVAWAGQYAQKKAGGCSWQTPTGI